MGRAKRVIDREAEKRTYVLGRLATGELSFHADDEDRVFETFALPQCPVCGHYPKLEKRRFGSQNRYRIFCVSDVHQLDEPQETPWLNNAKQAKAVWRMNCLMQSAKT